MSWRLPNNTLVFDAGLVAIEIKDDELVLVYREGGRIPTGLMVSSCDMTTIGTLADFFYRTEIKEIHRGGRT